MIRAEREDPRDCIIYYCTNKYAFIRRVKLKWSRRIRTNKISLCLLYWRSLPTNSDSILYGSLRSTHNGKNGTCGLKTSDQLTPLSIRGAVRDALLLVSRVTTSLIFSPPPRANHSFSLSLSFTLLEKKGSKHIDGRWRSTVARYTATRVLEGCESKY